jgi:hypothetical protein
MTDLSNHLNPPSSHRQRRSRANTEYWVYFLLIFVSALPGTCLRCVIDRWRNTSTRGGPIARAWAKANAITPCIFRA